MKLHGTSSFLGGAGLSTVHSSFRWLAYHAKVRTTSNIAYIRDCTILSNPAWYVLFENMGGAVEQGDWDLVANKALVFNGGGKAN